ncbi:hypothetical protein [Natrinema zhouii]
MTRGFDNLDDLRASERKRLENVYEVEAETAGAVLGRIQ